MDMWYFKEWAWLSTILDEIFGTRAVLCQITYASVPPGPLSQCCVPLSTQVERHNIETGGGRGGVGRGHMPKISKKLKK